MLGQGRGGPAGVLSASQSSDDPQDGSGRACSRPSARCPWVPGEPSKPVLVRGSWACRDGEL